MDRIAVDAENVAQAFLELLSLRGIEYFLANGGTDFASIEDGFARRLQEGKVCPRPLAIPHETVLTSMAYGYYQVTGKPQMAMVHVGVGTANGLGTLIAASRGRIPILFGAGRTPFTEEGFPASRNRYIHWGQEYFDQAGMVREFVKWDYELRTASQLEAVVDRSLTLAMTDPKGPVYLALPREVLASPWEKRQFQAQPRYDLPTFRPDPGKIEEACRLLSRAEFPLIITSAAGRSHQAVQALQKLAQTAGAGVISFNPEYMNFPTEHPCHLGFFSERILPNADCILVLDCLVPWYPNLVQPKEGAVIIQAGIDPFWSCIPMRSFPSDLTVQGESPLILSEMVRLLSSRPGRNAVAIQTRKAKIREMHEAMVKSWEETARAAATRVPLDFDWISCQVNQIVDEETIVVNEYDLRLSQLRSKHPGTYFAHPHAGYLGWGMGAALGIKLASPGKTVVATVGDGSYLFAVPSACHFVSAAYQLPILTIIYNNSGWTGARAGTRYLHPNGWAVRANRFPLSEFSLTADYEKICEAFGGYGERVDSPEKLGPALQRALRAVREEKRQAVLNVICKS